MNTYKPFNGIFPIICDEDHEGRRRRLLWMMMDDDYDRRRHNAFEGCQRDTTIAYDGERRIMSASTTKNDDYDRKTTHFKHFVLVLAKIIIKCNK